MIPDVGLLRKVLPAPVRSKLPKTIRVVPVSEARSQTLNRRYRKKPKPANVLSFRYDTDYGEIIVCPAVIRREARQNKRSPALETVRLVLHGLVHLAGIHHERSSVHARRAEAIERRAIARWTARLNGRHHHATNHSHRA